jgi:CHAT domain-containing protein/Flp pilus assembly protein TadD
MRSLHLIICILFLIFSAQLIQAQTTWETLFSKADKQFDKGKFSSAVSKAKSTEKTIRKKYSANETYLLWMKLYAAKAYTNQGRYNEMEKVIVEVLEKLKTLKTTDFDGFMTGFSKAAEYYTEAGYLLKADKILNFLQEELKAKPDVYWQAEVDQRQAVINTYLEKLNVVNSQLPKLTQTWSELYATSTGKNGKLSANDTKYRKQMYARLLTLAGEVWLLKGDYKKADSVFRKTDNTVGNLAGKTNPLYTKHLIAMGDVFFDQDDLDKAEKAYEKALKSTSKKQKVYLLGLEKLIRTTILDDGDADKYLNSWEKIADGFSDDENTLHLTENLLEIDESIKKKEFKDAKKELDEILEKPESVWPRNHPFVLELYERLYQVALKQEKQDLKSAEAYLTNLLNMSKLINGEEALATKQYQVRLADFYLTNTDDIDKARAILDNEPYKAIFAERSPFHKSHNFLANSVANFYEINDKYKEALALSKSVAESMRAKSGDKSVPYAQQLVILADIETKVGNYKDAENNMKSALKIIRKEISKNSIEYAEALAAMAKIYGIIGVYDEAEDMLRTSKRIYKKLDVFDAIKKAKSIEEMAFLYIRLGEFGETEEILNELLVEKEKKYGKTSRQLVTPLNQLGSLYLIKGDYTEAERLIKKANEIATKVYGDKSIKTAESYGLLAKYYSMIGDYERAEEYSKQTINIQKEVLGNNHVELAKSLTDMALIEFNQDAKNVLESEKLLNQAKRIMASNFDTRHPLYADILKTQGEIAVQTGRYTEGFGLLNEANGIYLEKLENRNLNSANIYSLLGDVYTRLKRFAEAKDNYTKAEAIFKKMLSKEHPDYIKTESKLGQLYFINKSYKEANEILKRTTSAYLDFIKTYFPALSEREKAKYWNKIQGDFEFFNSLAVKQAQDEPELLEKMYNFRLATKAILLSTSQKVRQRILNSTDEALKEKYKLWVQKKEELNAVLAMSDEQISEAQISTLAIKGEINELEKALSESSDIFADNVESQNYTWEEVQKLLQKDEAAVEIIRYRQFENGFTDKIRYAALVVTPSTKRAPKLVLIENGNELEDRYLAYYRNVTKNERDDKYSYDKYWKPIEKELGLGITRVFLSPDGVYNQINIESLLITEEQYVIDKMNVRTVSNTKDLIVARAKVEKKKKRKKNNQETEQRTAMLFGDPQFYASVHKEDVKNPISDLPGTAIEINEISQLFQNRNWKVKIFNRTLAGESTIKSLDSKQTPTVIHIATHGFFDEKKATDSLGINIDKEILNDPLRNSGVLARGAGDLLSKEVSLYDSQEGILTAYEAMSLNLDNTELVVLSACETGLGKVTAGEGVYGLQRAFLVAGADAIIMSLFKVDDEVTQKLMIKFYQKYLQTGDKRKAFNEAQKEIKEEYKSPKYWGAFNMIGVN